MIPTIRMRTLLPLLWLVIAVIPASKQAFGQPSHKTLDAPLPIHTKGPATAWFAEASRKYADSSSKLLAFLERAGKGSGGGIAPADLARTHVVITQFQRLGKWMEFYGEPSGADFRLRAGVMHSHLGGLIIAAQPLPATLKFNENSRLKLAKSAPNRLATAAKIEKLCTQQKWEAAEDDLFKAYDELEFDTTFFSPEERIPIYQPFLQAHTLIEQAMSAKRSAEAKAELAAAIQSLNPTYPDKLREMTAAVDAIAATGNAAWRSETVTGPQLCERIVQVWRDTQVQTQQLRGKVWAMGHRTYAGGVYETSMGAADPTASDPIAAEFGLFSQQVKLQLARLVEVDGLRATVDVAPRLYTEYLAALAPVVRQANDAAWTNQLSASLGKFLGKVPELDRQIQGYVAATDDLLRWKARVAAAQAGAKSKNFAPLVQTFQEATTSGKVGEANYIGLFPAPPAQPQPPQLLTDAPDIMPIAVQRLIGKPVVVSDVVRIAPESKAAIARYAGRTYANVPTPLAVQTEVDALKASLMVSPQAPPLSLRAMTAVVTADRQDLLLVGGTISGAYLEGVISRFATLPAPAVVLMKLGELPADRLEGSGLVHMLMRFEIAPQWVQHDYFFLNLAPPPTQTTWIEPTWTEMATRS